MVEGWYFVILLLLYFSQFTPLSGQSLGSNLRQVLLTRDTQWISDEVIIPMSWNPYIEAKYNIQQLDSSLAVSGMPAGDSVLFTYRVFENIFTPIEWGISEKSSANIWTPPNSKKVESFQLLDKKGLQYQGSFGRGIQVGNRQSLLLNSNFNLQLAGTIGDGVEVLGAISDNTIPIQPEGDTRQLEEFDKIFIQVKKDAHTVVAGDYQLNDPAGYFMRYTRKLSGIHYQYQDSISNDWEMKGSSGFAAARGKFARNLLEPTEGNQGPYQLSGNEGERFLVILAGTERVYWDGVLLKRGADDDYVIDYNQGQITFSYNRIVNTNARIIVEFEFIERDYGRSLFTANTSLSRKNTQLYFNAYQHQDSRQPSGNISLDSLSRASLQMAGDQLETARINGIRDALPEEINSRVLYVQRDTSYTVGSAQLDTVVYVYQEQPNESNALVVRFSPVGQNKGSYILAQTSANGRVYRWIAPDTESGMPQGDYSPEITISAPESHRMISAGGSWIGLKGLKLDHESLITQKDINRLSTLDDNDNTGYGSNTSLSYALDLTKNLSLESMVRFESLQKSSRLITPHRNAEFARDWSYDLSDFENEQWQTYQLALQRTDASRLGLTHEKLERGKEFSGSKQSLDVLWLWDNWKWTSSSTLTTITKDSLDITFFRPHLNLKKTWGKNDMFIIHGEVFRERQERSMDSDLLPSSFSFDQWEGGLTWKPKRNFQTAMNVIQRSDHLPVGEDFDLVSQATDLTWNSQYRSEKDFFIKLNLRWRDFKVFNESLSTSGARSTLLMRLDQNGHLFKQSLHLQTVYEVGAGQEPLIEFVFEERRQGEGTHIYEDLNNDGIRQINEYIPAPFTDTAQYVRIQLLNTNFITTKNLGFSQSVRFQPGRLWKNDVPNWTRRILWTSTLKTNAKTTGSLSFNPYQQKPTDSLGITFNATTQHNLYINRGHPTYDFQLSSRFNTSRNNILSGVEERGKKEYLFRGRYAFLRSTEFILETTIFTESSDAEFFEERKFDLQGIDIQPRWNWIFRKVFRTVIGYSYSSKRNRSETGSEKAILHGLNVEIGYRKAQNLNVQVTFKMDEVSLEDSGNTYLNYILLGGLRDGRNHQWSIELDKMLFNNIQMSLGYDGRKNGSGRVIHTGQAAFRANF